MALPQWAFFLSRATFLYILAQVSSAYVHTDAKDAIAVYLHYSAWRMPRYGESRPHASNVVRKDSSLMPVSMHSASPASAKRHR
jgi:hypothetical protein